MLIHTWERTWQYIKKAGTVILAIAPSSCGRP
jgi:ferrous iron transport protein B